MSSTLPTRTYKHIVRSHTYYFSPEILTMRPTTFGLGRSLWIRAKAVLRWSAIEVALQPCQRRALAWGENHLPLCATGIGRDNDAVFGLEVLGDVAEEGRLGVQVIDWNAEEAWTIVVS